MSSAVSISVRMRSYLADSIRAPYRPILRPSSGCASAPGAFCSENITWNTGLRLRSRSGASSSTILSKGRSWWAYAPKVRSRTCRSSSRKVGLPDRSARSARVLTKKPISASISLRFRLAMGVPAITSSCPAWRASSACQAASSGMKSVAPSARASSRSAAEVAADTRTPTLPPWKVGAAGRGRSVGSSSTGGSPSWSRQ